MTNAAVEVGEHVGRERKFYDPSIMRTDINWLLSEETAYI